MLICSRNFALCNYKILPGILCEQIAHPGFFQPTRCEQLENQNFCSQPVRAWVWQRVRLCWPWPPLLLHRGIFLCLWRKYLYLWEGGSSKYWINMPWNWLFNTQTKVDVFNWVPVLMFLWRVFSCSRRKYMRRMIQQTLNKQDPVSPTQKTRLANYSSFLVWSRLFLIA